MANKRERKLPWNKNSEEKIRAFMSEVINMSLEGQETPRSWGHLVRKHKVNVNIGYRIPVAMEELGYIRTQVKHWGKKEPHMKYTAKNGNWEFKQDGALVYLRAQEMWNEMNHTSRKKETLADIPLDLSPIPEIEKRALAGFSLEQIVDELNVRGYEVTIKKSLII